MVVDPVGTPSRSGSEEAAGAAVKSMGEWIAAWLAPTPGGPCTNSSDARTRWVTVVADDRDRAAMETQLVKATRTKDSCNKNRKLWVLQLSPKPYLFHWSGGSSNEFSASDFDQRARFLPAATTDGQLKLQDNVNAVWRQAVDTLLHSDVRTRRTLIAAAVNNNTNSLLDPFAAYRRRPIVLVSHIINEAFVLPFYINQHSPLFDCAAIIDYSSDDRSREVLDYYAPSLWEVALLPRPKVSTPK